MTIEPIAYVTGYYNGRCVVQPINTAQVLPTNMALYAQPITKKYPEKDKRNMTIEAMKLALEALESKYLIGCGAWRVQQDQAITALRTAIEQAEKAEPIAWMYPDDYKRMLTSETFCTVYSVECGSPTQGRTTISLYAKYTDGTT